MVEFFVKSAIMTDKVIGACCVGHFFSVWGMARAQRWRTGAVSFFMTDDAVTQVEGFLPPMSRLGNAIDAVEKAVGDLSAAIKERQAADKAIAPDGAATNEANHGIADAELRAMKSELHEAMDLLQIIQNVPDNKEGQ